LWKRRELKKNYFPIRMEGNGKESSTDSLQAGRVLLQGHKPAPQSKGLRPMRCSVISFADTCETVHLVHWTSARSIVWPQQPALGKMTTRTRSCDAH
jgi:hypothetical protein